VRCPPDVGSRTSGQLSKSSGTPSPSRRAEEPRRMRPRSRRRPRRSDPRSRQWGNCRRCRRRRRRRSPGRPARSARPLGAGRLRRRAERSAARAQSGSPRYEDRPVSPFGARAGPNRATAGPPRRAVPPDPRCEAGFVIPARVDSRGREWDGLLSHRLPLARACSDGVRLGRLGSAGGSAQRARPCTELSAISAAPSVRRERR
jgi:hypothetical protein